MNPLTLLRVGLPGTMVVAGVVLLVVGGEFESGAGVVLIGSGVLVALANALLRFSIGEMADRDREQDARDHYAEHGRWPDEHDAAVDPPPPAAPLPEERHPGAREATRADPGGRTRPRRPRRPPRRPHPGP